MKSKKDKQKHYNPVNGLIVLVLIALVVTWLVHRANKDDNFSDSSVVKHGSQVQTDPKTGAIVPKTKNTLTVSPQKAGTSIDIDQVTLQESGYVVIHESSFGKPGKIVAHSNLISAGTKEDLIIRYTPTAGNSYYAMLHTDDGNGTFNESVDLPIMSSQAVPVMAMFTVVK